MDIREQIMSTVAASKEAAAVPTGCKACERKGIPLFPLRVAAVPKGLVSSSWSPPVLPQPVELSGGEFKYALRTLRMGFLYVLLDKCAWQGYEVTADCCMRYFNPYDSRPSNCVEPLSPRCHTINHDIKTRFIHIDNSLFSEVWLAFSSDPWSKEVLEGYKSGRLPGDRFTKLTVSKDGKVQAEGGLVVDSSLSALTDNVAEFATDFFPNVAWMGDELTGGAHGFHSLKNREKLSWMGKYISALGSQYRCEVMAVPMNDPVGIVEELNIGRLHISEARDAYLQQPGVSHQALVSGAIAWTMKSIQKNAEASSQPLFERPSSGYPMAFTQTKTQKQVAEDAIARQCSRLQQSYDEEKRVQFQQEHDRVLGRFSQKIEAIGKDLAAWYRNTGWLAMINNDYTPDVSTDSWVCQFATVAACIQGGAMDSSTREVWLEWLEDESGTAPAYLGMTGLHSSAIEQILSASPDNPFDAYGHLKTVLGSRELARAMESKSVQALWVSRMAALTSSSITLSESMGPEAHARYSKMLQAGLYNSTGNTITLFETKTTVGKLQEMIRRDVNAMNAASAAVNSQVLSGELQRSASKVTTSTTGYIMGFTDPHDLAREVTVRMSTLRTPEELRAAMVSTPASGRVPSTMPMPGNPLARSHYSNVVISDVSLYAQGQQHRMVGHLSSEMIDTILDENARRFAGGQAIGLVLSFFMFAFQIHNLRNNLASLNTAFGDQQSAQFKTIATGLMMMGAASEVAGFGRVLMNKKSWAILSPNYVHPLVKLGGMIAGGAAMVEGVRLMLKGKISTNQGDKNSATGYYHAGVITLFGGGVGIYAGYLGSTALLGPLGIAALLIITGALITLEADSQRSNPLEVWLRRCCFGRPRGSDYRWHASSEQDMAECMAAFYAIVKGMVAEVGFRGLHVNQYGEHLTRLQVRLLLPGGSEEHSAWQVNLVAKEKTGHEVVMFTENHNVPDQANTRQAGGIHQDGVYRRSPGENSLEIEIHLWVNPGRYQQAILRVAYWPHKYNRHDQLGLVVEA
ncbi:T6SS effector BTH_I2691 family protein [Mangrovibacter phragmitis]|uniref:T6SS effector BTH_I2691 family protein n=1 Tax=Mangrovibacter phragmitis TaxID=1691903 RepID=UPI003510DD31